MQFSTSTQSSKHALRQSLKRQRKTLRSIQIKLRGQQASHRFEKNKAYQQAKHIAIYLPINGEFCTHAIIAHAVKHNKTIYLPVIQPTERQMHFAHYSPFSASLKHNAFNIIEPSSTRVRDVKQLDMIILPLVACTKNGKRLGMGGGYYDRALASIQKQPKRPLLVGLAHDFQVVNQLQTEPWDVPVDCVLTQRLLLKCQL